MLFFVSRKFLFFFFFRLFYFWWCCCQTALISRLHHRWRSRYVSFSQSLKSVCWVPWADQEVTPFSRDGHRMTYASVVLFFFFELSSLWGQFFFALPPGINKYDDWPSDKDIHKGGFSICRFSCVRSTFFCCCRRSSTLQRALFQSSCSAWTIATDETNFSFTPYIAVDFAYLYICSRLVLYGVCVYVCFVVQVWCIFFIISATCLLYVCLSSCLTFSNFTLRARLEGVDETRQSARLGQNAFSL